jgi:hypothetical protein
MQPVLWYKERGPPQTDYSWHNDFQNRRSFFANYQQEMQMPTLPTAPTHQRPSAPVDVDVLPPPPVNDAALLLLLG